MLILVSGLRFQGRIYFDQAKVYSKLRNFDVKGASMLGNFCQTLTPLKKGSFSGLPLGFDETSKKNRGSDQTFGKGGKTTGFLVGDVFF